MVVKEYTSVIEISGPLMIVDKVSKISYGEVVEIETAGGVHKMGQVLDVTEDRAQ